MAKGTYTINKQDENVNVNATDTSFKSFMAVLLIVLAVCIIIILAIQGGKLVKKENKKQPKNDVEIIKLDGNQTTDSKEMMVQSTTRGTTTTINSSVIITKINGPLETTTVNIKNKLNSTEFARTTTYSTTSTDSGTSFNQTNEVLNVNLTLTERAKTSTTLSDLVSTPTKSIPFDVNSSQTSYETTEKKVDFPTTTYLNIESSVTSLNANFTSEISTESGNANFTTQISTESVKYSNETSSLDKISTEPVPNNVSPFEISTQETETNFSTTPYFKSVTNDSTESTVWVDRENGANVLATIDWNLVTNYSGNVDKGPTFTTTQKVSTAESTVWVDGENGTNVSTTTDLNLVTNYSGNVDIKPTFTTTQKVSTAESPVWVDGENGTNVSATTDLNLVTNYSENVDKGPTFTTTQKVSTAESTVWVDGENGTNVSTTTDLNLVTNYSGNVDIKPTFTTTQKVSTAESPVWVNGENGTTFSATTYLNLVTNYSGNVDNGPTFTTTQKVSTAESPVSVDGKNETSFSATPYLNLVTNYGENIDKTTTFTTTQRVSTEDYTDLEIGEFDGSNFNNDRTKSTVEFSVTADARVVTLQQSEKKIDFFNSTSTEPSLITQIKDKNESLNINNGTINDNSSIIQLNVVETTINKTQLLHEGQKSEPVCSAVECKSGASRMLSLMKYSVDPCEDFYEFSCGGMQVDKDNRDIWKEISKQVNLINDSSPSHFKTFRTFYNSCVEHEYQFDYEERVSEVLKLVKEVGQISQHNSSQKEIDMTLLFGKLILRQSHPIINVDVDIDKQSSEFILKLVLPEKTSLLLESGHWSALSESQTRCLVKEKDELQKYELNLTKIHSSYLECQKNQEIYLNSVQAVVRTLGFYSHLQHQFNISQQIQELRNTIEWDILDYLQTLPPPNVIRKTLLYKNYVVFKISDLQKNYGYLNWNQLFIMLTGHDELKDDTEVQVYFPEYFGKMFQELRNSSPRKISNALIAMYAHNLYEHLVLPQAKYFRDDYCLKLSSKLFNDVVNNLYFKTWSNEEMIKAQKFTRRLFDKLQGKMETALENVTWLNEDSRTSSLVKLKKMSLSFNELSDTYNDDDYLSSKYSGVVLNRTNWFYNIITMMEYHKKKQYSLQGKPFSMNYLWGNFLAAYDKKPTSFYSKYFIMIPLGMLKQPTEKIPGYITMARIGLSLAREIGRHFDPKGVENGMALSQKPTFVYNSMTRTMKSESLLNSTKVFQNYEISYTADAELSTNERIADNTALKLITDSFNSIGDESLLPWISASFSKRKIFFIAVAQEYCKQTTMAEFTQQLFESEILPPSLRVENLVTNSKDFSDTFECPEGSPMNDNPYSVQFPYLPHVEEL